jgi:hypothetical protein
VLGRGAEGYGRAHHARAGAGGRGREGGLTRGRGGSGAAARRHLRASPLFPSPLLHHPPSPLSFLPPGRLPLLRATQGADPRGRASNERPGERQISAERVDGGPRARRRETTRWFSLSVSLQPALCPSLAFTIARRNHHRSMPGRHYRLPRRLPGADDDGRAAHGRHGAARGRRGLERGGSASEGSHLCCGRGVIWFWSGSHVCDAREGRSRGAWRFGRERQGRTRREGEGEGGGGWTVQRRAIPSTSPANRAPPIQSHT